MTIKTNQDKKNRGWEIFSQKTLIKKKKIMWIIEKFHQDQEEISGGKWQIQFFNLADHSSKLMYVGKEWYVLNQYVKSRTLDFHHGPEKIRSSFNVSTVIGAYLTVNPYIPRITLWSMVRVRNSIRRGRYIIPQEWNSIRSIIIITIIVSLRMWPQSPKNNCQQYACSLQSKIRRLIQEGILLRNCTLRKRKQWRNPHQMGIIVYYYYWLETCKTRNRTIWFSLKQTIQIAQSTKETQIAPIEC